MEHNARPTLLARMTLGLRRLCGLAADAAVAAPSAGPEIRPPIDPSPRQERKDEIRPPIGCPSLATTR